MALMEECGLENMEIIKALTPFRGIGGTGETCGGITGGLITLGLFGSDEHLDVEAMGAAISNARELMTFFENELSH